VFPPDKPPNPDPQVLFDDNEIKEGPTSRDFSLAEPKIAPQLSALPVKGTPALLPQVPERPNAKIFCDVVLAAEGCTASMVNEVKASSSNSLPVLG
jgi:hypothetical protein